MAEHSLSKFAKHATPARSGMLTPDRSPAAETEMSTTASPPESGKHAGDGLSPDGHAKDVRGY